MEGGREVTLTTQCGSHTSTSSHQCVDYCGAGRPRAIHTQILLHVLAVKKFGHLGETMILMVAHVMVTEHSHTAGPQ